MKLLFIAFTFYFSIFAEVKVYDSSLKKEITYNHLINSLPINKTIILSEYHFQDSIQKMEAKIINDFVSKNNLQGMFSANWEFLEYSNQDNIDEAYNKLARNQDLESVLKLLFPESEKPESNASYLPLLKTIVENDGELTGVNATRKVKTKLRNEGRYALDIMDLPLDWIEGSPAYLTRFKIVMQQHVPANQLMKYFEAQVYTDNIIASKMTELNSFYTQFLIIGSFHADYFDGITNVISVINEEAPIVIKLTHEQSDYDSSKLNNTANFILLTK